MLVDTLLLADMRVGDSHPVVEPDGCPPAIGCQASGGLSVQVVEPEVRRFVVAAPGGDNHGATIGREPWILQRALRLPDNPLTAVGTDHDQFVCRCGRHVDERANAKVAIVPESDVFRLAGWLASLSLDTLRPYYDRARLVLAAAPHPNARGLAKVQALDRRAREIGAEAFPLDIAVNFTVTGANSYGAEQKPCTGCGDCMTGCNVGAKNTLAMNYLPKTASAGAEIYPRRRWSGSAGGRAAAGACMDRE